MVGLTDAEVVGLVKALAKATNEAAEWQQRYFEVRQQLNKLEEKPDEPTE